MQYKAVFMHIQHVIWFRASHLHIKVKWLFDLKNTAGNAALSEALFLREEMQSGRPERVSLSLSSISVLSRYSAHIWDRHNNNRHNPSFSHWFSCYLLRWQDEATIGRGQILERNERERATREEEEEAVLCYCASSGSLFTAGLTDIVCGRHTFVYRWKIL